VVDIIVKVDGNRVVLDWGSVGLQPESVEGRLQQVIPLLELLLEAEINLMSLAESELEKRFRGVLAQNMIVEAAILSAKEQSELLSHIITGQESIADHGFPEFGDE
jgi:hypothetical protein